MEKTALIESLCRLRAQIADLRGKKAADGTNSPEFKAWHAGVRAVLVELGPKNQYLDAFQRIEFAAYQAPATRPLKVNYF